jgi:hypothetical protein
VCAVVRGIEADHRDPVIDQPGVLPGGQMPVRIAAAGKEPITIAGDPDMHPVGDGVARWLCQLEGNRPTGLLLDDRRSRPNGHPCDHVIQPQLYEIAAAQLAVDREVEQREITYAMVDGQPRSDFPDVLGLQRRLRADDAAGVPGLVGL